MEVLEEQLTRPNVFEIDLGAIADNTVAVRSAIGPNVRLFAALKANAYGFGLVEVAETVLSSGADSLSMAELTDAIRLRDRGVTAPILLYGGNLASPQVVAAIEHHNLYPTLLDLNSAQIFSEHAQHQIDVFAKVDVGLERLGLPPDSTLKFVKALRKIPRLRLLGVYAHMHIIDGPNAEPYASWQFERFERVLEELRRAGAEVPITMAASSAVLLGTNSMTLNAVDPGHLLYGLLPGGPVLEKIPLRPAFASLRTRLIQVKEWRREGWPELAPFESDGVNRIGILPIGRSDGMISLNSGWVLANGQRVRILGRSSLEHTRIDLTEVPKALVGDEVVIIGRQGAQEITTDEVMTHQGHSVPVALALEVRNSVPRRYLDSGSSSA
jgi:alanine racemase